MGFFRTTNTVEKSNDLSKSSVEFLHRHQCTVCPLNNQKNLTTPHMPAYGVEDAVVYFLGDSPTLDDDTRGQPFMGKTGRFLRSHIPKGWDDKIRFNNIVRTHVPEGREPSPTEIECCRRSVIEDIEKTKPKIIVGLGNIPLYWALGRASGITLWCGRKIPIQVGSHKTWFFPMLHPSGVLRQGEYNKRLEQEFLFDLNLRNAFAQIDDLPEPDIHTVKNAEEDVDYSTDPRTIISFIKSCYDYKIIGLDYETQRLRPYYDDARILTVALSHKDRTLAFPIDHPSIPEKTGIEIKKEFERFLCEAECRKVCHNLAFEQEWTGYHFGKETLRVQPWGDSLTQAYILDERPQTHNLDFLCLQYFGFNLKAISNLDKNNLHKEPLEEVLKYNGLDAKYHRLLYLAQAREIKKQGLQELYESRLSFIPTMALTQLKGVPVDPDVVNKFFTQYNTKLKQLEEDIGDLKVVKTYNKRTGKKFNPSAHQDVKKVFADLGFHPDKVDESELAKIDHQLAEMILEWRDNSKMLSTYVIPLMSVDELKKNGIPKDRSNLFSDEKIHPHISTTRTRTSRTSSSDPNEQNYPKHGENKKLRSQIRHPNPDYKIVAFDYAGIQARNVAMESLDDALIDAFWNNYDIHSDWRNQIVELYPEWIDEGMKEYRLNEDIKKKYRQRAKNEFVFASFFGARPKTTSQALGIPESKTEILYNRFWKRFPKIKDWHEQLAKDYERNGYVEGLSGFRRRAPVSSNELINCVDTETECLTEFGWRHVNKIRVGDKIYTKNQKTGDLELKPITKLNRAFYKGPVHVMNGRLSAITTPNHRWLVDYTIDHGPNCGGYEEVSLFVKSTDLPKKNNPGKYRIHLSADRAIQKTKTMWTDDEIELIGWTLTDGYYAVNQLKNKKRIDLVIMQSPKGNPEKVKMIDNLIARLTPRMKPQIGINKSVRIYDYGKGCKHWSILTTLSEKIYEILPNRVITPEFLETISSPQLKILYNTMLLGDGTWDKQWKRFRQFTAGTEQKMNMFSLLCVLLGQPHTIFKMMPDKDQKLKKYESTGNIVIQKKPYWVIELKQRHRAQPGFYSKWSEFDGEVWCPSTVNGTFFARRKGTVYVTGNSPIQSDETIIVCSAMTRLSELEIPRYQASLEVHDDLTFIWPKKDIDKNAEVVAKEMTRIAFPWVGIVPIVVEMSVGDDWSDVKHATDFSSIDIWKHKRKT